MILEPLGKDLLNFQPPTAYSFFVEAKDTHKSWQALQTVLFGTTMELMEVYKQQESEFTLFGFMEWQADHPNPSIKLISQIVLNYVLAIFLFKIGVRNNDVTLIDSARFKFDDLFYAFKHPIYREVVYRDLRNRVLYPNEVHAFRDICHTVPLISAQRAREQILY